MRYLIPALLAGLYGMSASASVNDIFPGDYTALPAGVSTATVYLYSRSQQGPYTGGRRNSAAPVDAHASIVALRLSRFTTVAEHPLATVLVVGASRSQLNGSGLPAGTRANRDGLIDMRLGLTYWLQHDAKAGNYLAIGGIAVLPTGQYDAADVNNIGENRWKGVLSVAGIHHLAPNWTADVIGELAWYGRNDRFAGSHDKDSSPSGALTAYLRYWASPDLQLFGGAQANTGASTRIDSTDLDNPGRQQRAYAGAIYRLKQTSYLNFRYAMDLSVENGLAIDKEWALRVVRLF